jgi:hypothetical protein
MKYAKYITAFILFIATFLCVGEIFFIKSELFEEEYIKTSLYIQAGKSQNVMKDDVLKTAQKHELEIFTIDKE